MKNQSDSLLKTGLFTDSEHQTVLDFRVQIYGNSSENLNFDDCFLSRITSRTLLGSVSILTCLCALDNVVYLPARLKSFG